MTAQDYNPKVIAFLCNWCSYAGADLAGTSRIQYPSNIRIIRVMCSARVSPMFILKSFIEGVDGVLLSGCHIGDCHYLKGNFYARRKFAMFVNLLRYVGIEPERFQMSWVSASEGLKFGEAVTRFIDNLRPLGPQQNMAVGNRLEELIEKGGDSLTSTKLDDLKKVMREILDSGQVRTVIGWEQGSNAFRSRPGFFRNPNKIESAIFSPACSPCLVRMLIEDIHYPLDGPSNRKPLGIVVRGCDDKGIIELIKDRRITREDVFVIGVDCPGVVDWTKARKLLREAAMMIDDLKIGQLTWRDRKVVLSLAGKEVNFESNKILMDKCIECEGHTPRIYDRLVGEPDTNRVAFQAPEKVMELEEKRSDEKWAFWEDVFSRCIRCFACRNICTYCYCEECAIDPTILAISAESAAADKANRPEWMGRDSTVPSNAVYLITRAYHGSGRCISCDECDRACPMGLPLKLLNRKIRKDAKALFDYEAGRSVDDKPMLSDACDTDPGEFIW